MIKTFLFTYYFNPLVSAVMETALENKSFWTMDEGQLYCGCKNRLAFRRLCQRAGIAIRHGMVKRQDIFNCLNGGTAFVPLVVKNGKQKQGDKNESNKSDIGNHQNRLGREAHAVPGDQPSRLSGRGAARQDDAAGLGRGHRGVCAAEYAQRGMVGTLQLSGV